MLSGLTGSTIPASLRSSKSRKPGVTGAPSYSTRPQLQSGIYKCSSCEFSGLQSAGCCNRKPQIRINPKLMAPQSSCRHCRVPGWILQVACAVSGQSCGCLWAFRSRVRDCELPHGHAERPESRSSSLAQKFLRNEEYLDARNMRNHGLLGGFQKFLAAILHTFEV